MTLAVVMSRALDGMQAPPVRVEVHLANGLPSFTLVGLADTEVKESRERVRAALAECGFDFPHNRRVTVSLAPADLPKESGRFDLPIALGVLAAAGVVPLAALEGVEWAGELSLAGELRPVRGALALALAARREGVQRLVLPPGSAGEAARVPGLDVRMATHLLDVVRALTSDKSPEKIEELPRTLPASPPVAATAGAPDLRDVRGQAAARRALEVAAAGGHSLLLIGPPGTGKSMLAHRLPSLLPPLSEDEALESAAVRGVAGAGVGGHELAWGQRPVRAPHHSASAAALVGGGSPPRPGEISLAHHGVLFLDELPEFPRAALEALREPLETGEVTLSRAHRRARYPARFQLVAAMNPCPCGWLGSRGAGGRECRCTPEAVGRYQSRLSGPLLDRIDLVVEVPALPTDELLGGSPGEASQTVARRVAQARAQRTRREARRDPAAGSPDPAQGVEAPALAFVERAARQFGWSGRSVHRVLRVARTVADLDGAEAVGLTHVAEAAQYRRGLLSG